MKTILTNLKRATIDIILLNLLSEGDMYGYKIVQEIKKRTNNEVSISEGSMYTILYRLEENGDISHYEFKRTERMTRVYYHITEKGLAHLKELQEYYSHIISVFNNLTGQGDNDDD